MDKSIQSQNTIEYREVLAMGITHAEYRNAVISGKINLVRRGGRGVPSLIEANSKYLLHQGKQNQNTVSL